MYRRCCAIPSAASSFCPMNSTQQLLWLFIPPLQVESAAPTPASLILRSSFCPHLVVVPYPQRQQSQQPFLQRLIPSMYYFPFVLYIFNLPWWSTILYPRGNFVKLMPSVSMWLLKQSQGHKGKGFKEWPWCTVLYFACRSDSLLLLWTKLPNNWTSYQPWRTWAAPAQEKSVTQKSNFPQFFVVVFLIKCVQYYVGWKRAIQ